MKKTVSSPRAAEQTLDKKKQSRFAALVGSPGSGTRLLRKKRYRRHLHQVGEIEERRTSRGRSTASGRTCPPVLWRVRYLPHQTTSRASTSRSAASTCVLPVLEVVLWNLYRNSPSLPLHQRRMVGTRVILRCEPPVQVSAQVARANGQTGANGGDFGYRTAMAFIVETAQKGTFRLRSELTGGYVNVGGLFQRYCLCASAPTAAEATSFEFVARQKDGNEPVGEPDPSSPGGRTSMERLRAQQL